MFADRAPATPHGDARHLEDEGDRGVDGEVESDGLLVVATASLVLSAGVAGLYSVMTLPEVQRRGIGTLMTVVPLRAARARGYRVGVLQSSPMGLSLYRRLGFQEYCRIAGYLWQGAGAGVQTPP